MQTPTAIPQSTDSTTIPTYTIGADSVILLGATALVSSKSEPGAWREVDVVNHLCACPGFEHRGHCRHVDAVRCAEELDRASAQPVEPSWMQTPISQMTNGEYGEYLRHPISAPPASLPRGFVR